MNNIDYKKKYIKYVKKLKNLQNKLNLHGGSAGEDRHIEMDMHQAAARTAAPQAAEEVAAEVEAVRQAQLQAHAAAAAAEAEAAAEAAAKAEAEAEEPQRKLAEESQRKLKLAKIEAQNRVIQEANHKKKTSSTLYKDTILDLVLYF